MRIKLLFKGDYAHEFGGTSRIWRTYAVIINGKDVARIEQEPDDYKNKFRVYNTPAVIGGNYIGQYKTALEAKKALRESLNIT